MHLASTLIAASLIVAPLTTDASDGPKIAVMETAFGKRGDTSSFLDAKQAGYAAIQMHSGMPQALRRKPIDPATSLAIGDDPSVLKSWQAASKKHGVRIVSLCAGSLNRCRIWDQDREVAMRIARQTIDACHTLGVTTMLFPFFGPSNFQESDEALSGVADFMKELLPYAASRDVVIGIEAPVTTVRVLELMERLKFPRHLKIYYDTGNLFAKEDIYETIRIHGKEHFCEIHIKPAGHAVTGQGQIDLSRLAQALDEASYDGWLVYEAGRGGREPLANREAIERIVAQRKSTGNTVDASQARWFQQYRKQPNAPAPAEMLLNTSAEPDIEDGFTPLFNGQTLEGWTVRGGTCEFTVDAGQIVGNCVPGSASTYLCTNASFTDFIFTCDMKWEVDGNSGVMFRAQIKSTEKNSEVVFGPQAEMEGFSKDRGWSGGIYGQSCGGFFYPVWLKEHKMARKALRKGEWNRLTVSAQGNVVKTWVNGVPVAHWIDDGTYSKGFFGLQIHKGNAGKVIWKNLRIREP